MVYLFYCTRTSYSETLPSAMHSFIFLIFTCTPLLIVETRASPVGQRNPKFINSAEIMFAPNSGLTMNSIIPSYLSQYHNTLSPRIMDTFTLPYNYGSPIRSDGSAAFIRPSYGYPIQNYAIQNRAFKNFSPQYSYIYSNFREDPQLQLSYLGTVPPSSFKRKYSDVYFKNSETSNNDDNIHFYPSDDHFNPQNDNLPPIMVSPYRFKTELPSSAPDGSYRPLYTDFSTSRPQQPNKDNYPQKPEFSDPFQPYTTPKDRHGSKSLRVSPQDYADEYLLFDIQPTRSYYNAISNYKYHPPSDSAFRVGSLVSSITIPKSQPKVKLGFGDKYQQYKQFQNQNFDTEFNPRTINGQINSNFHFDKGFQVNSVNKNQPQTSGTSKYLYPSEEVGKLVRQLIIL